MKQYIFVVAFVLFLIPSVSQAGRISSVAAVVNDDIITTLDVEREAAPAIKEASQKGAVDDAARSAIRKEALTRLVDKKLTEQKIKELGIKITDDDIKQAIDDVKKQNKLTQEQLMSALAIQGLSYEQYRAQLKDQMEKLRLVSQEVRSKIHVGEQELREYYESVKSQYQEDESLTARHIFFRLDKSASPEEVKRVTDLATSVLHEAQSGTDFAALAKKYSNDSSAAGGGNLGTFKKGDILPDLQETFGSMKPGEISGLVHTPAGIHILKLDQRTPGRFKPFDEVKVELEDKLYKKKSEDRFNQWVDDLKKQATIEIK